MFPILRASCVFPNRKPPHPTFFPKKMKCKLKNGALIGYFFVLKMTRLR